MEIQIDTSDKTSITLLNKQGDVVDEIFADLRFSQSERLLQEIDQLLIKNKIKKETLAKVSVHCGPGSYTGIRVGVTTANFLALSLNIPVVCLGNTTQAEKFQDPISAKYLNEPFITKEKARLT